MVSSIVEVSSTFVAPLSIRYLATRGLLRGNTAKMNMGMMEMKKGLSRKVEDDDDEYQGFLLVAQDEQGGEEEGGMKGGDRNQRGHLIGLARSGLWGIILQLGCLVSFFSHIPPPTPVSPFFKRPLTIFSLT